MALVEDQVRVRVAIAVASFTGISNCHRVAIITWSTPFTEMSSIALLALAPQNGTSAVTVHCKVIGGSGEGTGTGPAGVAAMQAGDQHVAVLTHFTEISCTMVPAVFTNASDVIAVICVSFAVTW